MPGLGLRDTATVGFDIYGSCGMDSGQGMNVIMLLSCEAIDGPSKQKQTKTSLGFVWVGLRRFAFPNK